MRHGKAGIKLNRTTSHRNAMFRNMVTSLFKYDRIKTTDAKAMELRRWADRIIALAKRGDLHARRQALSIIRERAVVFKVFEEAAERYGDISGGYTRIVKIGTRPGDAAAVALVELVAPEKGKALKSEEKKGKKPGKKKKSPEKKPKAESAAAEKGTGETAGEAAGERTPEEAAGTEKEKA